MSLQTGVQLATTVSTNPSLGGEPPQLGSWPVRVGGLRVARAWSPPLGCGRRRRGRSARGEAPRRLVERAEESQLVIAWSLGWLDFYLAKVQG